MSRVTDSPRRWSDRLLTAFQNVVIGGDDLLDAARRRVHARFGLRGPRTIMAFRGFADAESAELSGRVLAQAPRGGPTETDPWWTNLANTYRRFASKEVPSVELRATFRNTVMSTRTDHEGYYQFRIMTEGPASDHFWDEALVSLIDGSLPTPQPILQVGSRARFGVISDIDDTVLESSITDWRTAAQLLFLRNARTRKPLQGVAQLYRAFQAGADGTQQNPIFYVSSSPWNLYDLLDDFFSLNAIPPGPLFLRDFGTDPAKFFKTRGHGHKLDRARQLIQRFPHLRWVLVGDSGQADAELYAEAAREFGDRILAVYIRDVDLDVASSRDQWVDGFIEKIAGTRVPMLRVADSSAIAQHAFGLGLIAQSTLPEIAKEIRRDEQRPTLNEAAQDGVTSKPQDSPPQ